MAPDQLLEQKQAEKKEVKGYFLSLIHISEPTRPY